MHHFIIGRFRNKNIFCSFFFTQALVTLAILKHNTLDKKITSKRDNIYFLCTNIVAFQHIFKQQATMMSFFTNCWCPYNYVKLKYPVIDILISQCYILDDIFEILIYLLKCVFNLNIVCRVTLALMETLLWRCWYIIDVFF